MRRCDRWGTYVARKRATLGLTKRQLAMQARIDPSYLTLVERDGVIPNRDKVAMLGKIFGDQDAALLMAGFAPDSQQLTAMQERIADVSEQTELQLLESFRKFPGHQRLQVLKMLEVLHTTS